MLDLRGVEALTFDCYGTLIDWEAGILAGLRAALPAAAGSTDDALLEAYAEAEADVEAGPYRRYREVLGESLRRVAGELGADVSDAAVRSFGGSVEHWPAFPDSAAALARLATRFRLGVLTNCDDDLFATSARRLGVEFAWVVTAQQVGRYKPARAHFDAFLDRSGLATDRILHVAQSLYHDHVPARALGFRTAWIDRRHDRPGSGATPPAVAVTDATFQDLASFAEAALA